MLHTRLDGRSEDNNSFKIMAGNQVVATVTTTSNRCDLQIDTLEGCHIEKPNGFKTAPKEV